MPEGAAEPADSPLIEAAPVALTTAEPAAAPATEVRDFTAREAAPLLNMAPEILAGDNGSDELPKPEAVAFEPPAIGAQAEEVAPATADVGYSSPAAGIPLSEPAAEIDDAHPQRQLGFDVGDSTQTVAAEPVAQTDGFAEAQEMPSTPPEAPASTTAPEPRRAANDPRARPHQVAAVTVVTSSVPVPLSGPIDTSLPPPVAVSAVAAPRPANDPRRSRTQPVREEPAATAAVQLPEVEEAPAHTEHQGADS